MLNRELVSRAVICPRRLGGLLGGEHEAAPRPPPETSQAFAAAPGGTRAPGSCGCASQTPLDAPVGLEGLFNTEAGQERPVLRAFRSRVSAS